MMIEKLTRAQKLIRSVEEVALSLFGLVMLLMTMWTILKKHFL